MKIGRTHLQDAVPLTLGQEFSGCVAQVTADIASVVAATLPGLCEAGARRHRRRHRVGGAGGFARGRRAASPRLTGLPLVRRANAFAAQAAHDAVVAASGAIATLAASLMKIANDIRCSARDRGRGSAS